MKKILTLAVAAMLLAAYSSNTYAEDGSCGSCPVSGEKAKDKATDKAEEGAQS